jgi:hypothetical protein
MFGVSIAMIFTVIVRLIQAFDEATRKQVLATTIVFFRGLSAAKRDQK